MGYRAGPPLLLCGPAKLSCLCGTPLAALLQAQPHAPALLQTQHQALTKFHDLVVKCLIKLTKGLQASQEVR